MGTYRVDTTFRANGRTFRTIQEADYDNVLQAEPMALPGAKTGVLTTRTDDDTGSVTAEVSHGITTAAIVDVFWQNADLTYGVRRGMTVGTVSGTTVPIDGGAGDNLPLAATNLRLMTRHSEALVVTGNNVVGIFISFPQPGQITFADASNVELHAVDMTDIDAYGWTALSGITNPLAGDAVAKVFFSQFGTATQKPVVTVIHN